MKKRRKVKKSIIRETVEWTLNLAFAFTIVLLINSEVFAITEVSGSSMEDTLIEGEKLYLNKLSYNFSDPKAGDAIVFLEGEINDGFGDRMRNTIEDIKMTLEKNPRRNRYIKRVIAVPGDKIEIRAEKVYINDKHLEEDYVKGVTFGNSIEYPLTVPVGKLFVMGDNRENSNDSRMFGLVDYKSIEGKVTYRIWPLDKIGNNL